MMAWVSQRAAGGQAADMTQLIDPPAPGLVAVPFAFAQLSNKLSVTVDAHSASPAFMQDAKALIFDLFKIGAVDAEGVIEHVDAPNPEELVSGVQRRSAEKAAQIAKLEQAGDTKDALKLIEGKRR
jgi:hypothetical protein